MIKKTFITFILSLGLTSLHAQWEDISLEDFSKAILAVEDRVPKGTSYAFEADYFFFEQLESTDTTLSLHTELSYQYAITLLNMDQFGRLTVQTKDVQITCDTTYKQIILNDPNPEYTKRKGMEDFKLLLKSECKVQKMQKGKFEVYSIQFADGARYRGAEIWIEKGGMVNKYILYAGMPVMDDSGKEDKVIEPRLEVHFKNYLFGDKADKKKLIGDNEYFLNLKELKLQMKYEGYEIVDLRRS